MPWPIGEERGDGRRFAQSADRNKDPILGVLKRALPERGLVLEIGSGTGQHVIHFARALPGLEWQPTDTDPELRASVRAWLGDAKLANVREPIALDVHDDPWPVASTDAVIAINMIHVAPWSSTLALFARCRSIGASTVFTYGPYRRFGAHTSPSNEQFDASLRANDPGWGVRDMEAVEEVAKQNAYRLVEIVAMPSNNFSLVFRREEGGR